ncbi:MAG TPA: flippase-like domain-containing protein [Rhodobacteraceae bacterium]|nr:flippase-like domain-containing protein [Paracoccaceae bacterium]
MLSRGMLFFKTHKDLLFGLGMLALFLVGLGMIIAFTGWDETWASITKLGWGQLGILLALSLGNYALRALRWHVLARALVLNISLARNAVIYLAGFALTITPGRIGELVRLRWIKRETGTKILQSAPMMLGDRAADLAAVALLLLVAALLGLGGAGGVYWVAGLALGLALLASNPRLLTKLITLTWKTLGRGARLFASLRRAVRQLVLFATPKVVLPVLALSAIGWLLEGYSFYLLLGWLGVEMGFWIAVGIFLFSMLGGGATGLPGGLGGAEAVMVGLLSLQGVPLDIALVATIIIRITTLWFAILIGIIVFPLAERKGA